MKKLINIILASLALILTIIGQKIIFRILGLPYNNAIFYWGSFLVIFIIIFSLFNFISENKN